MTGTDPNYISAMEHFESMRHEDIYAATQQMDAVEILRTSGAWLQAAAGLRTSFPLTRDSVERVMNAAGWEGEAADAAYTSARSFAESVNDLADVLAQVGTRLGAVAAAAEAVKLAVVPPGSSGPVGTIARLLEAANVIDAQMAQEALRQEAVLTMNMVYKPAYTAAGTGVPALPPPPPVPEAPAPLTPPHPASAPHLLSSDAGGPNGSAPTPDVPAKPPATESDAGSPHTQTTPPQRAPENESPHTPGESPSTPPPQAPFQEPGPTETPRPENPDNGEDPPAAPPAPAETPPIPQPPPSPPPPPAPPAPPAPPPGPPPVPAPPESPGPPPVADPAGQPGVTGPVPGEEPRLPDQPGVIPTQP
ncbi:WXG100 family type VII secretion target [Nocardia paucivorans]|uniref:WXG100 family type VII secretion target n=1 Tax=Nocardia paucivorans TaxID=114259 RepID=UPI00031926F8|nr:hypothetical protein [Nocardia paucivorans]